MNRVEILDLADDARELVRQCEVSGSQTLFERNGRPVAVLVSYDEYLALRETIEIANDALLFARLAEADQQAEEGQLEEVDGLPRLRLVQNVKLDESVRAAFARIDDDPIAGAPLFEPLKGLWSYRDGTLRVIYRIVAEARFVVILALDKLRA
ncbi:MAG TPA: type II toxin-antitoxin system prevent-host-death family antitoxin [Thermoanaerobaculia bacterium]